MCACLDIAFEISLKTAKNFCSNPMSKNTSISWRKNIYLWSFYSVIAIHFKVAHLEGKKNWFKTSANLRLYPLYAQRSTPRKNPIGSSGWIQYYPINSCNGVGTFDFLFDHFSNWRVKASCMGKSLSSVDAYVGVVHWRKEKRQM